MIKRIVSNFKIVTQANFQTLRRSLKIIFLHVNLCDEQVSGNESWIDILKNSLQRCRGRANFAAQKLNSREEKKRFGRSRQSLSDRLENVHARLERDVQTLTNGRFDGEILLDGTVLEELLAQRDEKVGVEGSKIKAAVGNCFEVLEVNFTRFDEVRDRNFGIVG